MLKWLVVVAVIWAAWKLFARSRPVKSSLSRDEARARAVLGVSGSADGEAIRAAHRRLIAQVHPDRGGSDETTRDLNAARDLLLRARA